MSLRQAAMVGVVVGALALVAACVPDGHWFTPAGVSLGEIDCAAPTPLEPSGREICLGRLIPETPEEIRLCEAQGGTAGPLSIVNKRFACTYPKNGKAA